MNISKKKNIPKIFIRYLAKYYENMNQDESIGCLKVTDNARGVEVGGLGGWRKKRT